VQGGRDIPIQWLEGLQDPLDLSNPAGIHGMSAFIAAVAAAVSRQSNEAGGADHDG
jgi:hypothetical protein